MDGTSGGATFDYTYIGNNPGSPNFNNPQSDGSAILGTNSSQNNSTFIQISGNDDNGNSVFNFIESIKLVDGNIKGHLRVTKKSEPGEFIFFSISGASYFSANGTWILGVETLASSGTDPFRKSWRRYFIKFCYGWN